MRTILPLNPKASLGTRCLRALALLMLLAAALSGAWAMAAQTSTCSATAPAAKHKPAAHKPAHKRKPSAATLAKTPEEKSKTEAKADAKKKEPDDPIWPANEKPSPATVTWDSHGLRIVASNSSLQQIMDDVATATGATVEGLGSDQRVFGNYGPGPAREVLSQLLHGTGYNVVMVGDQGQGTPREIVLSGRHGGTATAAATSAAAGDEDSDVDEQPAQPARPAFGAGSAPARRCNSVSRRCVSDNRSNNQGRHLESAELAELQSVLDAVKLREESDLLVRTITTRKTSLGNLCRVLRYEVGSGHCRPAAFRLPWRAIPADRSILKTDR